MFNRSAIGVLVLISLLGSAFSLPPCDAQTGQSEPRLAVQTIEVDGQPASAIVQLRKKGTFRQAFKEAVKQSNEAPLQKLRLNFAMALRPEVREAAEDFLLAKANEAGMNIASVDAQIDPDNWRKLIELFIEYLPQLIKLIEIIIGLFPAEATLDGTVTWLHSSFMPLTQAA